MDKLEVIQTQSTGKLPRDVYRIRRHRKLAVPGTIKVGNGASSAFSTVNEQGACDYSLSEGRWSPHLQGGDTDVAGDDSLDRLSVVDRVKCRLADNHSGGIGTGSGSFTWTTTANTGTADRTGTITVMGDAIIVADGISVGTPGTATVAMNGAVTPAYVDCTGSARSPTTPHSLPTPRLRPLLPVLTSREERIEVCGLRCKSETP